MKILIAPDSYKECLSSAQVAAGMAEAVRERLPDASLVLLPMADGGEGTLDVLSAALQARVYQAEVHDPLGRKVQARLGIAGTTAILEVAQACGLQLLSAGERNPLRASSRGVGELLLAAHGKGCTRLLVGLGGSAICDGGRGMLEVAGVRELLGQLQVELLCDVDAPLLGPRGAARMFAPQKGASPEEVEILEGQMQDWTRQVRSDTGVSLEDLPGAGAAGGLGGAFMAYSQAHFSPGIQRILDLCDFDRACQGAQLILTGEGRSDAQTLMGKVPYGILQRAGNLPVALLSGRIDDAAILSRAGFARLIEVSPRSLPLQQALQPASALHHLRLAVHRCLKEYN